MAERKVLSLVDCGAEVILVSPEVTEGIKRMAGSGKITHIKDNYSSKYLEGVFLVIGATDNDAVNAKVSADCMDRGLLVNIVDDPPRGNFYVPAVLSRGHLQIAISTGGKSPMMSRIIKERLSKIFTEEYSSILELVGEIREKIIRETPDPEKKEKLLAGLLNAETVDLIWDGKFEQAKERIKNAYNVGRGEL